MPIEQFTKEELRLRVGRVDRAKIDATTEEDIQRHKREDGFPDEYVGPVRVVFPGPDVRALRKRIGMTQQEFVIAFDFSLRTLQGWQQRQWSPDAAGRVLLSLIDQTPRLWRPWCEACTRPKRILNPAAAKRSERSRLSSPGPSVESARSDGRVTTRSDGSIGQA
jgi:putative transcriptional regulator